MRLAGLAAALALSALPARTEEPPSDEAVFSAMRAEMARTLARLSLSPEGSGSARFGPPYFAAYRLTVQDRLLLSSSFGSEVATERRRDGGLYVEVRFGDRSLDNTSLEYRGHSAAAPWDPEGLRQKLWELSDQAYKGAIAGTLEKKARKATERDPDRLDDLSAEEPARGSEPSPPMDFDPARWGAYLHAFSAALKAFPHVYGSEAVLVLPWTRRYLLTSEGTQVASPHEHSPVRLALTAWTRSADGMGLDSARVWVARSPAELPALEEARAAAEQLARELGEDREAPLQEPLTAPAVLDPEFTGVFFHEALGHKLEGQRQRDPDQSHLFRDRVGEGIAPAFLSLVDDPTLAEFRGVPLHGHYRFDDEGVPARRVALVERGVLKAFLMSRWPLKGFSSSNGHGRADYHRRPTGRMSNLIVEAHAPVPARELMARLRRLCREKGKPYGFWLVGSSGGENPNNRRQAQTLEVRPRRVFRVDAKTGRTAPVRGVKMIGTPLVVVNRIVAAGDDAAVANNYFCTAESGTVPVAQAAPSVLVSEVELQRVPESRARPPILMSPFHED